MITFAVKYQIVVLVEKVVGNRKGLQLKKIWVAGSTMGNGKTSMLQMHYLFSALIISSSERKKSLFKNISGLLLFSRTTYVNVMESCKSWLFNKITKNMIITLLKEKETLKEEGKYYLLFKGTKSNMPSIRKIEIITI